MEETEQITQFWLNLFKASCNLNMKENSEDDFRPLDDYLEPKVKRACGHQNVQPSGNVVKFLNLKKCYEKIQTRRDGISVQRPVDCNIRMLVVFDPSWTSRTINVFVLRHPESAKLCGDLNGKVDLKIKCEEKQDNLEYFSVDLDSVYKSRYGKPVYRLSTVDSRRRNRFLLVVRLSSLEQNKHQYFMSSSFLIRSRKPRSADVQLKQSREIKPSERSKEQL